MSISGQFRIKIMTFTPDLRRTDGNCGVSAIEILRRSGLVRKDWARGFLWVELLPQLELNLPYFIVPHIRVRALLARIYHENSVEAVDVSYPKQVRRIPVAQASACVVLIFARAKKPTD